MKKFEKYWKYLVCALLCLLIVVPANAQSIDLKKMGSITINYPIEGAEISFYQVASVKADGSYEWAPEYEKIRTRRTNGKAVDGKCDPEMLALYAETTEELAETMTTHVYIDKGSAVAFLPVGLYVMTSKPVRDEEKKEIYHFSPTMVEVPRKEGNEIQYVYEINAKYSTDPIPENPKKVHCTIIKGWDDIGPEHRPDEVIIDIYRDYELQEKQSLNSNNNWQYEWINEQDGTILYLIERSLANGYRYWVEEETIGDEYSYRIVNTFDIDLFEDEDNDGTQTPPPGDTTTPPPGDSESPSGETTPPPFDDGDGDGIQTPPPGDTRTPKPGGSFNDQDGDGTRTPRPGNVRTSDETNMTLPVIGLVAGGVVAIVIALRLRGSKDDE